MDADTVLGDRYRLSRLLASGGMGQVWQAHDAVLDRDVAIKVLSGGSKDEAALERFRREAVTMGALQHPNTVLVFDAGSHEGSTFIVMELLPGPTLSRLVTDRGPLPEAEVARLGAQVAAGLEAAHRAGIVHRDIKPGNLMLGPGGVLKVVDFGVARLTQETASALTATNTVVGSAQYVSPEQAVGEPADERSDLYALGCVLTVLATGRPPFQSEHLVGTLHQHVHIDPAPLSDARPDLSPALVGLVAELLAKNPDDRPGSAAEVERRLRDIEAAANGGPPTAPMTPIAPPRALDTTVAMGATRTTGPTPRRAALAAPLTRKARAWWVAGAALVSTAVFAATALTHDPAAGEEADTPAPSVTASTSPTPTPSASPSPTPSAAPTTAAAGTTGGGQATAAPAGKADAAKENDRGKADDKKTNDPASKAKSTKAGKK